MLADLTPEKVSETMKETDIRFSQKEISIDFYQPDFLKAPAKPLSAKFLYVREVSSSNNFFHSMVFYDLLWSSMVFYNCPRDDRTQYLENPST